MTVQLDAVGDTVKVSTVTDRIRASVRDRVKEVEVRTEVRVDTVYVAVRDSVYVSQKPQITQKSASPLSYLKWVFWIIIGLIALVVVFKIRKE